MFVLLTVPRQCFFCGSFLLLIFHICLYYAILSIPCSLAVTCWERADLLALLCVIFSCVFVTFTYGVLGQVWYLIVSIPDLCLLLHFVILMTVGIVKNKKVCTRYIHLLKLNHISKHIINKTSEINNIHNIMTIKGMIKDLIKYCIYPRYSQYHHYQRHDKKDIMTFKSIVKCIS